MTSQPPARNQSIRAGSLSSGDFLYCREKSTPQAASINNYSGRSIVLEAVCLSFFVTIKRLRGQEQRSMRTGRSDAPKPSLSVKTSAFVGTWVGEERLVFERRSVTRVRARPPLATARPTQGSGCRVRANVGRETLAAPLAPQGAGSPRSTPTRRGTGSVCVSELYAHPVPNRSHPPPAGPAAWRGPPRSTFAVCPHLICSFKILDGAQGSFEKLLVGKKPKKIITTFFFFLIKTSLLSK